MHEIPSLNYKYGDLEPYFDEETMRLHHTKHHQAYVDKLNAALEAFPDVAKTPVEQLLKTMADLPETLRPAVQNHGGGHYNHTLWWQMLRPARTDSQPHERTINKFDEFFGGVEGFKKQFSDAALGRFGSGWAWLTAAPGSDRWEIETTANQDSPIMNGKIVLLGVDVWEHAYYLKYQNRRAEYLTAFWNVVNWEFVERQAALVAGK